MRFLASCHRLVLAAAALLSLVPSAGAASGPSRYLKKPETWFASQEAKRIAGHILSYQSELGGWPKNIDTTAAPFTGDRNKLTPIFDNDATTDELRNGYAWLGYWPQKLLKEEYPSWKQKQEGKAQRGRVRIVLVGDSTVAEQGGWGPGFAKLLGPNAECINLAKSGRNSKSYHNEGHWKTALGQRPDCVLIQFGHNDMPGKGPDRETDPKTTYRAFLARYVEEARAAGARPVLITPMTRRLFTREGKIKSDLGPYVEAVKALAQEKKVPLVDLHARSIELLDKLGPEAAAELNPPSKEPGKSDRTHLSAKGAEVMGKLVAEALRRAEPELAQNLR
jgi:lysophospholipase L1-like esterase